MKICPRCGREYDNSMSYCLDDGGELLYGPGNSGSSVFAPGRQSQTGEHATALFSSPLAASNDDPKTAILPSFESPGTTRSVAVLPFANISADEDNEYFCDGLAEELLNSLSRIDGLKVAARTSAFSFRNKNLSIREIAEKLGVRNVLEGSVRRSGDRLRISVQLVNAADGFHIWSERYDRQLKDIFDLEDEITLAVTEALKMTLLGEEREAVLKHYTDNAEAYEFFLKGRYHHFKYSLDGWKRAIEFFQDAVEIEPLYAPAYAGMSSSWGYLWFFGLVSSETAIPRMKEVTARALSIDERLAESHRSEALVKFFYDREWRNAEAEFKRAIELDPRDAETFSFYSMFLAFEYRIDEAVLQARHSLVLDPLSLLINMNAGWTYFTGGMMAEAMVQVGKMIEIEPEFYGSYWLRGAIAMTEGDFDSAVDDLRKGVELGGHQTVLADLGSAYGLAGRSSEAQEVLTRLLGMRERDYVSAVCLARVYCRLGDSGKAVEWLEKAVEEKNGEMLFLPGEAEGAAENDPLIELGGDPRVVAMFRRMLDAGENA